MKNILFAVLLFVFTQAAHCQESAVKKSVQTFFKGLQKRDTLLMQEVCYKHLVIESITEYKGQGRLDMEVASEFYKQVAAIPPDVAIEERILDYKIKIDGTLAHVWAPYEFYVDGKISHSGVNSFQLFNDGGLWKIIYIVDTRRAAVK